MIKKRPSLDIITISFNSRNTINKTLESIRKARKYFGNYIVIDGGSTDGTLTVLQANNDIITQILSEKDQGISDAFNKGIKLATADYILLLNSDDWLIDGQLKQLINMIDANDEIICTQMYSYWSDLQYNGSFKSKPNNLPKHSSVLHPGALIGREVYNKVGLYDLNMKIAMDYDLFCRCDVAGISFRVIDLPLVGFREGGTSARNIFKIRLESYKIRNKYYNVILPIREIIAYARSLFRLLFEAIGVIGRIRKFKKYIFGQ
jgi:glycosyltransferase involved in cell wall biosynthesis